MSTTCGRGCGRLGSRSSGRSCGRGWRSAGSLCRLHRGRCRGAPRGSSWSSGIWRAPGARGGSSRGLWWVRAVRCGRSRSRGAPLRSGARRRGGSGIGRGASGARCCGRCGVRRRSSMLARAVRGGQRSGSSGLYRVELGEWWAGRTCVRWCWPSSARMTGARCRGLWPLGRRSAWACRHGMRGRVMRDGGLSGRRSGWRWATSGGAGVGRRVSRRGAWVASRPRRAMRLRGRRGLRCWRPARGTGRLIWGSSRGSRSGRIASGPCGMRRERQRRQRLAFGAACLRGCAARMRRCVGCGSSRLISLRLLAKWSLGKWAGGILIRMR